MKCFMANVAFVGLFAGVREAVIFIVAFLVEAFTAKFANPRLKADMNANMSGKR